MGFTKGQKIYVPGQMSQVKGRGQSAFAAKHFNPGDFICDYGGVVRKKLKRTEVKREMPPWV